MIWNMNTPLTPTPVSSEPVTQPATATSTAFTDPGVVTNCGAKRLQVSNTGNFDGASNVNWAGDAHRFYNKVKWAGSGNYAGFAVETAIEYAQGAGPCHGGVWAIVTASGAPGASFASVSSVFRKNGTGSAYASHAEVWDYSDQPGLNVGYNAEFNANPIKPGSQYIGFNIQPGAPLQHVVALQAQSNPGALDDQYDAVLAANCRAKVIVDARGSNGIPLAVNSTLLKFDANRGYSPPLPAAPHSYLPIIVDGTTLLIPMYNAK